MKLLKTITEQDIFPGRVNDVEEPSFEREAARAIVFDAEGKVALLHVTRHHCYKLPGGGINPGEPIEEALKRECLEEVGCNIEITGEVGETYEIRSGEFKMKQKSYCFLAQVVGEKGENQFEGYEITDGMKLIWVPLAEAITLVKNSQTDNYGYKFTIARDLALLEEAKKL